MILEDFVLPQICILQTLIRILIYENVFFLQFLNQILIQVEIL